jgi:hypothetical protein
MSDERPVAYREGDRIRSQEGYGYGDMVTDSMIWEHIDNARAGGKHVPEPGYLEFAEAVLRLRATEREAKS